MISNQADIIRDQAAHPAALDTGQWLRLTLPEITVVYRQRISARLDRGIDQCLAGRHPADYFTYLRAPLHLHAIRGIIIKVIDIEETIQIRHQIL